MCQLACLSEANHSKVHLCTAQHAHHLALAVSFAFVYTVHLSVTVHGNHTCLQVAIGCLQTAHAQSSLHAGMTTLLEQRASA